MKYIKLTNGTARLREYFGEAATVRGRYVGIDGDEEWACIEVKCNLLYNWIMTNERSPGKPTSSRVNYQITQINSSILIDTPVFYSGSDTIDCIELIDGRHRICAFHQLGAKSMFIVVPESQQAMFLNKFG